MVNPYIVSNREPLVMLVSISTCGFPEIGIPPTNHQFLDGIFHEINHPAIVGTTMYGNTPYGSEGPHGG